MYSVALSVVSCLRAGTEVQVAWIVESEGLPDLDPTEAIAITPGGGRMGSLASGALDGHLRDVAVPASGRLITVELTPTDALIAGVPAGGRATLAVVPAVAMPESSWAWLLERRTIAIVAGLDGERITSLDVLSADTAAVGDTPGERRARELLEAGSSCSELTSDRLITVLAPVPRLAVFGGGPNAQALENVARLLGWQVARASDPDTAIGLMVGLSPLDAAVVMGHDVESSSRVLGAALESDAGYIGALGSTRMQEQRADWLAYRGVTDLSRVHGPAGLDIGARSAPEIALSVLSEAVAVLHGRPPHDHPIVS